MRKAIAVAILAAAIETTGFLLWLAGIAADKALLGLLALDVVLVIEHVVTAQFLVGRVRFLDIFVFSQIETFVVWGAGLAIGQAVGFLPASVLYWTIGLTVEHTLTNNVLFGRKLFAQLFDASLIFPSFVEALAGILAVVTFPFSRALAAVNWFALNSTEHVIMDVEVAREFP